MRKRSSTFVMWIGRAALGVLLTLASGVRAQASDPDDINWFPNTSLNSSAILVDRLLAVGDDLYATGRFETIGGKPIQNAARWDGNEWHEIGGGVGSVEMGLVHTLVVRGDDIYVGGMVDMVGGGLPVGCVAHWNGTTWNTMAGGTDRAVRALAIAPNGDVYAGGEFTKAGGVLARGVARWDGSQWHALGTGLFAGINNHVSSLAMVGSDVYVGGAFTVASGLPANYIARWDGAQWHTLGTGANNLVTAITSDGRNVYVGGRFTQVGGIPASCIAKWNGASWSALGRGITGAGETVRAICVDGNDVYAGGYFSAAGTLPAHYIGKWDGSEWTPLGSGTNWGVKAIAKLGERLFVGGEFDMAGSQTSYYLAEWGKPEIVPDPPAPSSAVMLYQNHPNPFNPTTTIRFSLPTAMHVTLRVFDTAGRLVRTLVNESRSTGANDATWHGRDALGRQVATGVYFYRLQAGTIVSSRKMILLK